MIPDGGLRPHFEPVTLHGSSRTPSPPLILCPPRRRPAASWHPRGVGCAAAALLLAGIAGGSPIAAEAQIVELGVPVQTLDLSLLIPPSPDPAGLVTLSGGEDLLVADSEVNEMALFQGVNLWELTTGGAVLGTSVTDLFSDEPTGLALDHATGLLFVSDDDDEMIYVVDPGLDLLYGTLDDLVSSIDTLALGADDPEGVSFDASSGRLFFVDGDEAGVWEIDPGPNGVFDGAPPAGDDLVASFDVSFAGATDPEGIVVDETTGTLLVADRGTKKVYELTKTGTHLRTLDLGLGSGVRLSGIAIAVASDHPTRRDLYLTDRGVDNNTDPDENDGRLYEFAFPPLAGNAAPQVEAGAAQSAVGLSAVFALAGAASDDGHPLPSDLTLQWTQLSGPGTVTFADPSDPATSAAVSSPGLYRLELRADDGSLDAADEVTLFVTAPSCGLGPELVPALAVLARRRARGRRT